MPKNASQPVPESHFTPDSRTTLRIRPPARSCSREYTPARSADRQRPEAHLKAGLRRLTKSPPQRGQVGDPGPGHGAPAARFRKSRVAHQPGNVCGSAIDRTIVCDPRRYRKVLATPFLQWRPALPLRLASLYQPSPHGKAPFSPMTHPLFELDRTFLK